MSPTSVDIARIAKALADPQRLELLARVAAEGELTCSELVDGSPLTQATVSHHLRELVEAGLIERRKEGQFSHFRFQPAVLQAYLSELRRRFRLKA